jgi:hypothetical protein
MKMKDDVKDAMAKGKKVVKAAVKKTVAKKKGK